MSVSDWADLMPHTITVKALTGRDRYMSPTYATGTDYAARVVLRSEMVRNAEGQEVVSRGHVYIGGVPSMSPDDQIVLPDGSTPELLAIETYPDEDGDHHVKVFFA